MEQINFFACWYKFREAESYFNNSGVGMVKTLRGHSGHKIIKLVVSQEWIT